MTQEEKKLPEGLEEAADKYAHSLGYDEEKERVEIAAAKEDFIAGAEWDRAKMMEKAVGGIVAKTKKSGYTSLRYDMPNGMWDYLYVECLDAKPGDKVTIIIKQDEP